jgi:hypothetical protein
MLQRQDSATIPNDRSASLRDAVCEAFDTNALQLSSDAADNPAQNRNTNVSSPRTYRSVLRSGA